MAYIVDTNILIRSKNEMPIELWPSFWSKLCQMMADGHILSNILVATAAAKGYVLVTNETSDPICRRRVKIPDACNALGVRYCDLNQVLRELGITI